MRAHDDTMKTVKMNDFVGELKKITFVRLFFKKTVVFNELFLH